MLPLIVLSFLLLQISCFSDASVPYKELWFNQDVDHFSFNTAIYGKSTFRERYLVQGNPRTLQITTISNKYGYCRNMRFNTLFVRPFEKVINVHM